MLLSLIPTRDEIWQAILDERAAQDAKYGGFEGDANNTPGDWIEFIKRHADKACDEPGTRGQYKKQMIRVAALAVAAIEYWGTIERMEAEDD